MSRPIVLLTDFGYEDPFVGEMKGVIARLALHIPVIDLCHNVPPHQVFSAAWMLFHAYTYFPPTSVFCAVVDPGVGTEREILLAKTSAGIFIAPDNGLLAPILEQEPHSLFYGDRRFGLSRQSNTFHGRDLFAPLAARAALGMPLTRLGRPASTFVKLEGFFPQKTDRGWQGKVAHIDRFGNVITNLECHQLHFPAELHIGPHVIPVDSLQRTYGDGEVGGEWIVLESSNGCLEVALREQSAAQKLQASVGTSVQYVEK